MTAEDSTTIAPGAGAGQHLVILGGGVCGLYAALTALRHGARVTVLEREPVPGGLAAGNPRGDNFYDLGVHMLHAFDKGVFEDMKEVLGDERIEVELDARIRWAGGFYRYPLQFGDMIKGIPFVTLSRAVIGLLWSQTRFKLFPRVPVNAEDALIQLYGRTLYRFFFEEFTHRYWGIHPRGLSATFITTKMPRLTAVDVIKKALGSIGLKSDHVEATESALLKETLHYSKTGAETMPRLLAERVEELGGKVILNQTVVEVRHDHGPVTGVLVRDSVTGETRVVEGDHFVSTMPVNDFVRAFRPLPAEDVVFAANRLAYKPIAIYGLLVRKQQCIDALYIYYRDRVFHRVGEPKNAGLKVTPEDHTVLIVESTCEVGDEKWEQAASYRRKMEADLEAEGICKAEDIVECHVLRARNGYPIFALGFEPHHDRLKSYIDAFPNVVSTGRQGGFCYPNMHKAMRMGADAVEQVLGIKPQKGGR